MRTLRNILLTTLAAAAFILAATIGTPDPKPTSAPCVTVSGIVKVDPGYTCHEVQWIMEDPIRNGS